MAEYTAEQIAQSRKITAWADEQERQERDARRATYLTELRKVTGTAEYAAVEAGLRNLMNTVTADDNMSFHVASLVAAMERIDREVR